MARILIAEDDPLVSSFIEKGLRANGFSTVLADDGEQAQHLGLTGDFDLMILDMSLPEREGFEVLQELRSRGTTLPVLVLTGRRERDAAMCLEAGADDYMSKPFSFAELLARVRVRIRAKEELDRLRKTINELQLLNEVRASNSLRLEQIDLHSFTEELAGQAKDLAPRRWTLDRAADGTLVADRRRVAEAVMNLAHNAVQHTDDDEAVWIGTAASGEEVRFWIRDGGPGLSEHEQARGPGRERGLGLRIAQAIAEAHGGRVELESRPGEGSTFTMVLPRTSTGKVAGGQNSDR